VDEVPLGDVPHTQFVELVVRNDVRPERPDEEDADCSSQLTDAVWDLAVQCWAKDPKKRPTADLLCDAIIHLLQTQDVNPQLDSSPATPLVSPGSSLFSAQASPISASTSPSSSGFIPHRVKPSREASLIDLDTEIFQNYTPFTSNQSTPSSRQPSEGTLSSQDPFRERVQILTPPTDLQVPSSPTPPNIAALSLQFDLLGERALPPPLDEGRTAGNDLISTPSRPTSHCSV
jgi:hypothetical protein